MPERSKTPSGRILKIKVGYNPNSSSIGSAIPYFLGFSAGAGALSFVGLHALQALSDRLKSKSSPADQPPANEDDTDAPGHG